MQDVDLTTPPAAEAALPPPRDQEGDLNPAFVTAVAEAVEAHDGARVRALMADVHEADVGDLLEALDPSCRPRLSSPPCLSRPCSTRWVGRHRRCTARPPRSAPYT